MVRNEVMTRDVVGEQRLNVDDQSTAVFENAYAFVEDPEKLFEVRLPVDSIPVFGVGVPKTEVVRRRSEDEVHAVVGQFLKDLFAVAAQHAVQQPIRQRVGLPREVGALGIVVLASTRFFLPAADDFAFFVVVDVQALVPVEAIAADLLDGTKDCAHQLRLVLRGRGSGCGAQDCHVELSHPQLYARVGDGREEVVRIEVLVQRSHCMTRCFRLCVVEAEFQPAVLVSVHRLSMTRVGRRAGKRVR